MTFSPDLDADMEKVASVTYRGKTFPGYNQPIASDRAQKKRMVLVKRGDRVKLVHFGQKGYRHNYSDKAKANYLRRSAGIKGKDGRSTKDDPFSPNYWARKVLWPEGEKTAALDILGAGLRRFGARKTGDALVRAHHAAGDAVESRVKRALDWEVPYTKGKHLPGLSKARREDLSGRAAKMSRAFAEDPLVAGMVVVPAPGSVIAAGALKKSKDALRRRMNIQPPMQKAASLLLDMEKIALPVRRLSDAEVFERLTSHARAQAAAVAEPPEAVRSLARDRVNASGLPVNDTVASDDEVWYEAAYGIPAPTRLASDVEKVAASRDPSKFAGKKRLPLTPQDKRDLADLKRRAGKSGFSAVRTEAGVAIYTHRSRSDFKPSFAQISTSRARFVDSTG